jgi:hypothetical protein
MVGDKVPREAADKPIGERCVVERAADVEATPYAKGWLECHPPCQRLKYLACIVDGISDKQDFLGCFCQQRMHNRRGVSGWHTDGLGSGQNQVISHGRRIRVLSFVRQDFGHRGDLLSPPPLIQQPPDAFGQL